MKILITISCLVLAVNFLAQPVLVSNGTTIVIENNTNVTIDGGITLGAGNSLINNGNIYLRENPSGAPSNWTESNAANTHTGTGNVYFRGTTLQSIIGNAAFYGLYNENPAGLSVNSDIVVNNRLQLDGGLINVPAGLEIFVTNNSANSIATNLPTYANSYVHGRLARNIANNTETFVFPIGKIDATEGSLYAPISLRKANAGVNTKYQAEYFPLQPIDRFDVLLPLDHISEKEYWHINNTSNPTNIIDDDAFVGLSYRPFSVVNALQAVRDSLAVAHYIDVTSGNFSWMGENGPTFPLANVVGDANNGWVYSLQRVQLFNNPDYRLFTLGTISRFNPLPGSPIIKFTATLKQGNTVELNFTSYADKLIKKYALFKLVNGNYSLLHEVSPIKLSEIQNYIRHDFNAQVGINTYQLRYLNSNNEWRVAGTRKVLIPINEIKVFPNPTTDFININCNDLINYIINIYNAEGKLVYTEFNKSGSAKIDVSKFASGQYFVNIICNNKLVSTIKFIKQ